MSSAKEKINYWKIIPLEVHIKVFSYLSLPSLISCKFTDDQWSSLLSEKITNYAIDTLFENPDITSELIMFYISVHPRSYKRIKNPQSIDNILKNTTELSEDIVEWIIHAIDFKLKQPQIIHILEHIDEMGLVRFAKRIDMNDKYFVIILQRCNVHDITTIYDSIKSPNIGHSDILTITAAKKEDYSILRWLHTKKCKFSANTFNAVIGTHNIYNTMFMQNIHCPFNAKTFKLALKAKDYLLCEWLAINGCKIDVDEIDLDDKEHFKLIASLMEKNAVDSILLEKQFITHEHTLLKYTSNEIKIFSDRSQQREQLHIQQYQQAFSDMLCHIYPQLDAHVRDIDILFE